MEKFFNLPEEKQNEIFNAALNAFGSNGYKKTSVSDIARAGGISKAMVFHYFGTKKALYLYLINMCGNIIIKEITEKFDSSLNDFFERIRFATDIKLSVIKKHPAILTFLNSVYFETDDEVKSEIKAFIASGEGFRNKIALDDMDSSKFKDGINPKLVLKMLVWFAEGFVSELPNAGELDLEVMMKEFNECMDLLRNNFYKEEFV